MTFSPDYVRIVLNENFEDAKQLLLDPLLAIHDAHLVMLCEQGILSRHDAVVLRDGLATIDPARVRAHPYDGTYEDLFFYVESLIVDRCGAEVAGRLHTARSRNDIDMTMYRMQLRGYVLDTLRAVLDLRSALVEQAATHTATIFPAHTHTQPAQPTTVAHYLMALVEELERDSVRLVAAFVSTNRNPLGACAITGTGFPIDRHRTSALLGFSGPTGNTYGSIATVDYLLESTGAAVNVLVGCGRFVQDMLLWSTTEVGYLRLPDGFVQSSSIMPQKRNPVALEHARSLLSKAFGQMLAIPQAVHNTPFGDIVDTEDDLQPLVAAAFNDTRRGVSLVAAAMAGAEFNVERMAARAATTWVTITELADTLAREHDVPFAAAHTLAGDVIRRSGGDITRAPAVFADAVRAAGYDIAWSADHFARVLSPAHFVAVRETTGGPGAVAIAAALAAARHALDRDRGEHAALEQAIEAAGPARALALAAL